MPSPFPGMNPYLEQERVWHDFHERFIPVAAELLSAQVDPNYIVKIDEHVYIHELPEGPRRFVGRGDVSVARLPQAPAVVAGVVLETAPVEVLLPAVDFERISFIEVRDRDGWELITVVELLSPSNKYAGPDREQYLAKRAQLLASPVNLVELDLLRGGPKLPLEDLPVCDYYALVSRAGPRPRAKLWPFNLRDPLPEIPIPLREGESDARLNVREALDRVYDAARYKTYVYLGEPQPLLAPADAQWAAEFISR